jgi:histidine triad (HIT) family protein
MDLCVFCEIINGKIKARKIYETKYSTAFLDAFPLKEGHSLIISKRHKKKIQDLNIEEISDIFTTLQFLTKHIEKAMECDSSLIAIHNGEKAGQEIPHVHIHIIPIKKTDKINSIHSMFIRENFLDDKNDEIWKKITNNIQIEN